MLAYGCFHKVGVPFVGVLVMGALHCAKLVDFPPLPVQVVFVNSVSRLLKFAVDCPIISIPAVICFNVVLISSSHAIFRKALCCKA